MRSYVFTFAMLLLGTSIGAISTRTLEERRATTVCLLTLEAAERTVAETLRTQELYRETLGEWLETTRESAYADLREVRP